MASDDGGDNRLLALYRRYVGEPESEIDVYLGFALFFGGIALGLLGFVVFIASLSPAPGTPTFWAFREVAIVLAAVGLPALLSGIVVLLPVGRRARYAALAGGGVCLLATGVFVAVYPANWNVRAAADYSAQGIAIYATGLAVLVASTGAALVAHHLERAQPAPAAGSGATTADDSTGGGGATDAGNSVSASQVEADIESAMADVELSWGGVEKRETKRLNLTTSVSDVDRSAFAGSTANTARASGDGVDDAVAGLQQLKGGATDQATGSDVDQQTTALTELRKQQRAEATAEPDGISGIVEGLKDRISLR